MWLAMPDITLSSEGKLLVAILNSPELRSALMTNSDGEVSVIVPSGRPGIVNLTLLLALASVQVRSGATHFQ